MEVDNDEMNMQCYKIPCNVVGNLKISCDTTSSTVVLWSKYQLIVYENLNFTNFTKNIKSQFEVVDVIVLKDYLLCLDCSGNININTDDLFIIWKQNIKCICMCEINNTLYVFSLQFEENGATLLINECNSHASPNESVDVKLKMPDEDWITPGENIIMVSDYIKSEYSKRIKEIFNAGEPNSDFILVIICLDKRNVHGVLISRQSIRNDLQVNSKTFKLYSSYTDIVDINISMVDDIHILVGLAGGSIIKILLLQNNKKPEVYHLNTALNKFTVSGNDIIYTDVLTMWNNINTFLKTDPKFEQFKVRNVRDFCLIRNQITCVTYANLIYLFDINHFSSYLPVDCKYEGMVSNSDYLQELIEITQKNEEIVRNINKESEYLMALSLSQRQDIMDDLIEVTAAVYEDYRDLSLKHTDLTLTDELNAYYDSESYCFLISIFVKRLQHKLNKLVSDVLGDIKIHIVLFEQNILKTTSIQIEEQLTKKNFVISLKRKNRNIRRMQVHVKIVTRIPGKFDDVQSLWTILYSKCIDLNAENFITTKATTNNTLLKEDDTPLETLIYKKTKHLHGTDYIINILDDDKYKWTFYVKLPDNCNLQMDDILRLSNNLDSKKAYNSLKHLIKASKDKKSLEFQVGKELVQLNIDGGDLKITCVDIIIASEIRNFFSRIIFNAYKGELTKTLIHHKHYTIVENFKRDINNCIDQRISTEEFKALFCRFLQIVYCLIPI